MPSKVIKEDGAKLKKTKNPRTRSEIKFTKDKNI